MSEYVTEKVPENEQPRIIPVDHPMAAMFNFPTTREKYEGLRYWFSKDILLITKYFVVLVDKAKKQAEESARELKAATEAVEEEESNNSEGSNETDSK